MIDREYKAFSFTLTVSSISSGSRRDIVFVDLFRFENHAILATASFATASSVLHFAHPVPKISSFISISPLKMSHF